MCRRLAESVSRRRHSAARPDALTETDIDDLANYKEQGASSIERPLLARSDIPDRPVVQPVSIDAIERPRARLVIKPPAIGRDFELIPESLALTQSKSRKTDYRCHAILSFARGRFLAAGTK